MSKRTNSPIGEVVCPHKGCDQVCKVYKFRPRTEGRRTVFTGKHYAECDIHGRIGSDGNPAVTDYILDKGKIWGGAATAKSPEKPAAASSAAPKQTAKPLRSAAGQTPKASASAAPEKTSKSKWWETVI